MIPQNFSVNVDQTEPFRLEIKIGQNLLMLGLATLLTVIYYNKAR